jgi:hypothetical protein
VYIHDPGMSIAQNDEPLLELNNSRKEWSSVERGLKLEGFYTILCCLDERND